MRRRLHIAVGLVAAGLMAGSSCLFAEDLKVGDPAPDVSFQGTDGKTYKIADFRDKQAIVIAWYPKAFTGGCTKECKSFREHGDALRKTDAAYFTASCDTVEKNKEFAKSLDLDYVILSDPSGEAAQAFGVYNADRKVARRVTFIIGKDGKIARIDDAVKTGTHGLDVAKMLEGLGKK